jgi:hypothetical protein
MAEIIPPEKRQKTCTVDCHGMNGLLFVEKYQNFSSQKLTFP